MTVKNFNLGKTGLGVRWLMTIAFFVIFDPIWTHILAPTDPNMRFLKHNFNFQSLRKTEAIYIIINYVTSGLTNELKQFFTIFDPKWLAKI